MEDFRHRAACRDVDPELFFPTGTGRAGIAQTRRAKAVCRRCDVQGPCLDWAMDTGQAEGVWGGLDPDERRTLRRLDRHGSPHWPAVAVGGQAGEGR